MTPPAKKQAPPEDWRQVKAHHQAVKEFLHGTEPNTERTRRVRSPEAAQAAIQAEANRELARKYRQLAKEVESRGELVYETPKKGYQPMVRRRIPPLRNPTDPIPVEDSRNLPEY